MRVHRNCCGLDVHKTLASDGVSAIADFPFNEPEEPVQFAVRVGKDRALLKIGSTRLRQSLNHSLYERVSRCNKHRLLVSGCVFVESDLAVLAKDLAEVVLNVGLTSRIWYGTFGTRQSPSLRCSMDTERNAQGRLKNRSIYSGTRRFSFARRGSPRTFCRSTWRVASPSSTASRVLRIASSSGMRWISETISSNDLRCVTASTIRSLRLLPGRTSPITSNTRHCPNARECAPVS